MKVTRVGEYLVLDMAIQGQFYDLPLELTAIFPGQVVDPGPGKVSANKVTFVKGLGLPTLGGATVVAFAHPGPPLWVTGAISGLALGVLLTLLGVFIRRRRRRTRSATAASATFEAKTPSEGAHVPSATPATPDTSKVQSAEPARPVLAAAGSDQNAMFAPPDGHPPALDDSTRPAGQTGQAAGRAEADAASPPPKDHSIWAPRMTTRTSRNRPRTGQARTDRLNAHCRPLRADQP